MKVRCISPHGGAHYGTNGQGDPVGENYDGPRQLPPNPGGYVSCPDLSPAPVAVGSVIDAPDGFVPDGYNFEAVAPAAPAPPPAPEPAGPAEGM